jgi:hypothetical protein
MNANCETKGDLGEFIISELNRHGVPLRKTCELPRLPAMWRPVTVEIGGAPKELGVRAQGCLVENVVNFCLSLLSPLRVHRPFSKDNDRSFWFSIDGKQGSFTRTDTGLVISFVAWGVTLSIGESGQGLHVGFVEK